GYAWKESDRAQARSAGLIGAGRWSGPRGARGERCAGRGPPGSTAGGARHQADNRPTRVRWSGHLARGGPDRGPGRTWPVRQPTPKIALLRSDGPGSIPSLVLSEDFLVLSEGSLS